MSYHVIVHKNIFLLYNPINFLAILHPTTLANLVVEVETRHSHQILLFQPLNWVFFFFLNKTLFSHNVPCKCNISIWICSIQWIFS